MYYLPGTNNTCWIKEDIFYVNDIIVDLVDGCYTFLWFDGHKAYDARLVHFACKVPFPLGFEYYSKITVVSKNGVKSDFSEENLLYYFTEPLECELKTGFYLIPDYTRYALSEDGQLFDLEKWCYINWGVVKPNKHKNTTGGYRQITRLNDRGRTCTLKRYRAILAIFKGIPEGVGGLVPDHINGIPSDDRKENLEWVTRAVNNQRAYDTYLRPNASRVLLVKNLKTNEILKFPTVKQAADYCGYPTGTFIYYRMRDWPNSVYSDYWHFKFDDGSEWPELDWSVIRKANNCLSVAAYDIVNNKIITAPSAATLGRIIGLSEDDITRYARKRIEKFIGGYWIRYPEEMSGVPVLSPEKLEILKSNGWKTGVMVELVSEERTLRGVVVDVATELGIAPAMLFSALRKKKTSFGKYTVRVID